MVRLGPAGVIPINAVLEMTNNKLRDEPLIKVHAVHAHFRAFRW